MDTEPIDIGHGITAALRLAAGLLESCGVEDGVPVGVLLTHACATRDGEIVQDWIPTHPKVSTLDPWSLDKTDPITLRPSVSWTCCGLHGFVTDGKWVPA